MENKEEIVGRSLKRRYYDLFIRPRKIARSPRRLRSYCTETLSSAIFAGM